MATKIEKIGARIYFVDSPFSAKDAIKAIGGHWDGDRRQWWVGSAKAADAAALVEKINGGAAPEKTKQDPRDIRLTGKARYKGRVYYTGFHTRDFQKIRMLTLPDANGNYLDFWVPCNEIEQIKTYQPRERTYRGRTEITHTTLGSMAKFVADAREAERDIANGVIPPGYCVDLEDGIVKRRGECDMPSE